MTEVLDVVGLAALVTAACCVAVWLGLAVFGVGCLAVSWALTSRRQR